MTHARQTGPQAIRHPWTIARIQNALAGETLIRRFLLDLAHAPEHRVMEVFTAWRNVAATIEANSAQQHSPKTAPRSSDAPHPLTSASE